ncbi:MAG TPA: serpin family protein [Actinomycetes bacterium]
MTYATEHDVSRRTLLTALGLLTLGGAPVLAACGSASRTASDGSGGALRPIAADVSRVTVKPSGAPGLPAVVAGMAALGAHLHAVAADATDNFTLSPLSIAVAFGMLRAGSRGTTATQIDAVLGFPSSTRPEGSPHQALNALTAELVTPARVPTGQPGPAPIVAIANGLFVEKGFGSAIQRPFLDLLAAQYGAHADSVDFRSPTAAATINAWVAQQTRGRITKLFDRLDTDTLVVLADAVYLKAGWQNQFGPDMTTSGAFSTSAGTSVQARFMHQVIEQVRYVGNDRWQRVTLPYVGGQLTMRVVLPRTVTRDRAALTGLLSMATGSTSGDPMDWVDLAMPRWDTGTDLDLLPLLATLGLTDLGDLAGIAGGLQVSQAVHRANITVDEKGSEAAAVTGIAMDTAGRVGTPNPMRADRPYVWAVVHEPTQTPVFVGHVVDPTRVDPTR